MSTPSYDEYLKQTQDIKDWARDLVRSKDFEKKLKKQMIEDRKKNRKKRR